MILRGVLLNYYVFIEHGGPVSVALPFLFML